MKKTVNLSELERLINILDTWTMLEPKMRGFDPETVAAHTASVNKIIDRLREFEGAKITGDSLGWSMSMAGIRATCTSGAVGVLYNWRNAAERKMAL